MPFNIVRQDITKLKVDAIVNAANITIRNAISLGGDSDTLAAITDSIAQAAYGIPEWIKEKALTYLDVPLREVYDQWCAFVSCD
jgi:ADP-ribosylglycohydrolase